MVLGVKTCPLRWGSPGQRASRLGVEGPGSGRRGWAGGCGWLPGSLHPAPTPLAPFGCVIRVGWSSPARWSPRTDCFNADARQSWQLPGSRTARNVVPKRICYVCDSVQMSANPGTAPENRVESGAVFGCICVAVLHLTAGFIAVSPHKRVWPLAGAQPDSSSVGTQIFKGKDSAAPAQTPILSFLFPSLAAGCRGTAPPGTSHGAALWARSCPPRAVLRARWLCSCPAPGNSSVVTMLSPENQVRGWASTCGAESSVFQGLIRREFVNFVHCCKALFWYFCDYFIREATWSIPALPKPKAAANKCQWYASCGDCCRLSP